MAKAEQLPSERWRCRAIYIDETGKKHRKSFTADKKKDAERMAQAFLAEYKHNLLPENKTLRELAESYIENRYNILSPSTIIGYKKITNNALQDIVDIRVGILTKEMYQRAINNYSIGRSPKTVISAHTFFNKILKDNDIYIADKVNLPQKVKKETDIPTDDEVAAFLYNIKGTEVELFVMLSTHLGLRRSESIAIKWRDVDLNSKTILINKARVKDEFNGYVEKTTKTLTSTRRLSIPDPLLELLQTKGNDDEYIIESSPDAIYSAYKRACKKYNFPYNFHALRHYYASVMLRYMPNKYAQERMGHATDNMLRNVYQHTDKKKQDEYNEIMSNFFIELEKKKEAEETPENAATV